MANYKLKTFPKSRIATIDIGEIGKRKHHVIGMFELDVTSCRETIKAHNRNEEEKISFNAWMISVIACTLKQYDDAASFLKGKKKRIVFDDINVSVIVEKNINGQKVPIPLIVEKAHERSVASIARQISDAKDEKIAENDVVLYKKQKRMEKLYYSFPGFLRRYIWNYVLKHPKIAFQKMGNVAFTTVGMMGHVNGWFVPFSIHPVCFGLSTITKKPVVINDNIEIREILNMTVLLDHDVMDGAPMARLIRDLTKNVEKGLNL